MKNLLQSFILLFALVFLFSCSDDESGAGNSGVALDNSFSGSWATSPTGGTGSSSGAGSGAGSGTGSGTGTANPAGVITAGEWNDLENWDFWQNTIVPDFMTYINDWEFYPDHRVDVRLSGMTSLADISIELLDNGISVWKAKTNNQGKAVLWANLYTNTPVFSSQLSLSINNGQQIINNVVFSSTGENNVNYVGNNFVKTDADIAFVVDATGSMGDEIEYLKVELQDVLLRAQGQNPQMNINTASVFYRDVNDEYLTRVSPFSNDFSTTTSFIQRQGPGGGGDYPEAVHSGLDEAVNTLTWSNNTKAKILFLILDAPPHSTPSVKQDIKDIVQVAAEKGIAIIPISASGINNETEFLLRSMAIATNGTYVFITDHSGIGNSHLQAKVGDYDVEFLNDLMVRLIDEALL